MAVRGVLMCAWVLAGGLTPSAQGATGVLTHKTRKHLANGKPTVTRATLNPKQSDFVLRVEFDKFPADASCSDPCGRAAFLIDTDGDPSTGLQQGGGKPVTGADLSILLIRPSDDPASVRAVVRQFADEDRLLEDADVVQQLDSKRDSKAVVVNAKQKWVEVVIDASSTTIPAAKHCRFVYQPLGAAAIATTCVGIAKAAVAPTGSDRRAGGARRPPARAPGAKGEAPKVTIDPGGPAYRTAPKPRVVGG